MLFSRVEKHASRVPNFLLTDRPNPPELIQSVLRLLTLSKGRAQIHTAERSLYNLHAHSLKCDVRSRILNGVSFFLHLAGGVGGGGLGSAAVGHIQLFIAIFQQAIMGAHNSPPPSLPSASTPHPLTTRLLYRAWHRREMRPILDYSLPGASSFLRAKKQIRREHKAAAVGCLAGQWALLEGFQSSGGPLPPPLSAG